ncbi:MAG: thiamine pyrophosphate-dependent dehydrogenase E1 component subunit alpha [Chloroflexi bacterium]|nr:thiamine pyrophosphate-dependent dehydrogenase E1 component subunit alpha [Chloroflexota bacterium]
MAELTRETLIWMYERMTLIRTFEDRVAELFAEGLLPGFVHLYAGEEAIAVGACAHLTDRDTITSTHRGHGHCIAKGVPVAPMMAELFGKATGACKGKGGSMHIADVDKGMLGANGIVGGGGPMACGAALTNKLQKTGAVTLCFFGDGAAEQGTMHEAMNLASIWRLPIVFVCENNLFAESTPWFYHCAAKDIAERGSAYNMPGLLIDGCDIFAVHEAVGEAIARARRGEGPSLIEARAFRYYGHFQGDAILYRTPRELEEYRRRDPLTQFRKRVVERGLISPEDLDRIEQRATEAVELAVTKAKEDPYPAASELLTDVYVTYA